MQTETSKYASRLFEIKKRTEVIAKHVKDPQTKLPLVLEVEFLCLQFRKIIEEIAFLSLIANKEEYSKQYDEFEKHWNAKLIFKDLERINPRFYPEPSKQIKKKNAKGEQYTELSKITTGFMTKSKAIKIYDKCGGMMHATNPYRKEPNLEKLIYSFKIWLNEIITLMNHHTIVLYGKNHMVAGIMASKENGNPQAFDFGEISQEEFEKFNSGSTVL